jgi:hypothetical protein
MQDAPRTRGVVRIDGPDRVAPSAPSAPSERAALAKSFAAGWSAVPLDAEASRRLAQQRIGFFAGVFLILSVAFFLRNSIAIGVLSGAWPPFTHPAFLLHEAALVLHGAQWSWCRFGQLSRRQLDGLDAIGLVGAMALYGAVTVAEVMSLELAVAVQSAGAEVLLVAIILLALVLIHAIIVPLDARRMFALSAATASVGAGAAYLVVRVGLPPEVLQQKPWLPLNQLIFVGMWGLAAVAGATIAARVIHGLSQRVRDANEIGQYVLEERIGEGGMGVVYLARHALLRRPTAIKLLPAHRAGEKQSAASSRRCASRARSRIPTPSPSSTSAAPQTASSTTRWSISTASRSSTSPPSTARSRPLASSTS